MLGVTILVIIGFLIMLTWILLPVEFYIQNWIDDFITDRAAKKKRKIVEEEEKRREELQKKREHHDPA